MSFALKYNFPQVARESGFQLRSYKDGQLDWRLVGSVEIERVLRDQNLEQVDSVLGHLSEVPLASLLETNILDTGIAKYFVLSQFAVQYLLFCRKFLEETVADLREAHGTAQMEIATLKRSLSEANTEILQLHKKVTQMEAIHEVIYPCHLCTKNFVSNDALNLHISRKHGNDHGKHENVRNDTPATATTKDREKDINLINAIKLELEVKHLKERLNNAERKIRENIGEPSNDSPCACDKTENTIKHSVGIQSNLTELKESDEVMDDNFSPHYESTEQINELQHNMQELNQWKEQQKLENATFLADIERKFKHLTQTLESTQNQQKSKIENNEFVTSSSIKDLELFLNKKVEDIVKSSEAKMDEVINKMEKSSNTKLDQLEKQLHKLAEQADTYEPPSQKEKEFDKPITDHKITECISVQEPYTKNSSESRLSDNGFIATKTTKAPLEEDENVESHADSSEKSSLLSNNTYIKSGSLKIELENETDVDETDISDGIQDDEDDVEVDNLEKAKSSHKPKIVTRPRIRQKPVTRKMATKLANSRLLAVGIETKTKSLSQISMAHATNELNKKRNVLKNKHPNFYATRNKIKKFVDKLCSLKMPENAGELLKATRESENKRFANRNKDSNNLSSTDEDDSEILSQPTHISTPLSESKSMHNVDFKQRLENILASPIKKPEDHYDYTTARSVENKPIPLPRKKVMFTPENI